MALNVLRVESLSGEHSTYMKKIGEMSVFGIFPEADNSGEVGELPQVVSVDQAIGRVAITEELASNPDN